MPFLFYEFWIWLPQNIRSGHCYGPKRRIHRGHRTSCYCIWRWPSAWRDRYFHYHRWSLLGVQWPHRLPRSIQGTGHPSQTEYWSCWCPQIILFPRPALNHFKMIWEYRLCSQSLRADFDRGCLIGSYLPSAFQRLALLLGFLDECYSIHC